MDAGRWQRVAELFDEEAEDQSNVTSDNRGYYIQAGYLFPNKKFEIAARLGMPPPFPV